MTKWESELSALNDWLTEARTEPALHRLILHNLSSWHSNSHSTLVPSSQDSIGWYSFLLGYIHQDLLNAQKHYYSSLHSRRSEHIWGGNLIHRLWKISLALWSHRNHVLHNDPHILAVRISLLDQAIRNEYTQHTDSLPESFHPFFNRSLEDQLSSPLTAKLSWLRLIRTGRESTGSSCIDIFSSNGPLRQWLGLPSVPPAVI